MTLILSTVSRRARAVERATTSAMAHASRVMDWASTTRSVSSASRVVFAKAKGKAAAKGW
jgi:SpoU rRNA methylase family enzyme